MSSLVWLAGNEGPVATDPDRARITDETVRTDGPAEWHQAPDWNQSATDDSLQLEGLRTRQLASDLQESVQYVPDDAAATVTHNVIIDRQVATSGTAAAREQSGEWGHGTFHTQIGIDPLPYVPFGQEYFQTNYLAAQEGSGSYMTSPIPDDIWQGVAQEMAVENSRQAYAGLYDGLVQA